MAKTITIVIHGTFAREERWWRLGGGGQKTFADNLGDALAGTPLEGTVWTPALGDGVDYEDFDWTGANKHRDRVAGGKKLAQTLGKVAARQNATPDNPLTVNLVAHSHGGNVVLEALKRLGKNIKAGKVVFLGTPMLSFKPSFRLIRLVLALVLIALVILAASLPVLFGLLKMAVPIEMLQRVTVDPAMGTTLASTSVFQMTLSSIYIIGLYGMLFAGIAVIFDLVWYPLGFSWMALRGRLQGQVYGCAPGTLKKVLGGEKLTLFTSYEDEADLLLDLGSAPEKLYKMYLRQKYEGHVLGRIILTLEKILLRPIIGGLILKGLEAILEIIALGQPRYGVFLFDYQMAEIRGGRAYPESVLAEENVSNDIENFREQMKDRFISKDVLAAQLVVASRKNDRDRSLSVQNRLSRVLENLKDQIVLRHSLYYQSPEVIEKVGRVLVG
jgi:hypothetical protein